jgi:uncharacterized protein YqgQ
MCADHGFQVGTFQFQENAAEVRYARELMKNETARLWHDNLMRKSDLTADVYLRGLNYYCKRMETDPEKNTQ